MSYSFIEQRKYGRELAMNEELHFCDSRGREAETLMWYKYLSEDLSSFSRDAFYFSISQNVVLTKLRHRLSYLNVEKKIISWTKYGNMYGKPFSIGNVIWYCQIDVIYVLKAYMFHH